MIRCVSGDIHASYMARYLIPTALYFLTSSRMLLGGEWPGSIDWQLDVCLFVILGWLSGLGLVGRGADGLLLGTESRALCRCSKPSTTKQHPWP